MNSCYSIYRQTFNDRSISTLPFRGAFVQMCRSKANLTILTGAFAGLLPLFIFLLFVEDLREADTFYCPVRCTPCGQNSTGVFVYLNFHNIAPLVYGWPLPANDSDWEWFGYYVCTLYKSLSFSSSSDYDSSSSGSSSSSSSSSSGVILATPVPTSSSSDSSDNPRSPFAPGDPVACCCVDVLVDTYYSVCPRYGLQVPTTDWLVFFGAVGSCVGLLVCLLMYVFLLCGCIEPVKGALEELAEGVQNAL